MTKIGIVTGSVRPGRQSLHVATWIKAEADRRGDARYEILDIADHEFPVWDEGAPPRLRRGEKHVTREWAARVEQFDGFVFVVSEYNHSISGALKNALDYLDAEFHDKAAGLVSYGGTGGVRAAEHLRGILSELEVAHVRNQVAMPMLVDFPGFTFSPSEGAVRALHAMLDQLLPWTRAMQLVRSGELAAVAA